MKIKYTGYSAVKMFWKDKEGSFAEILEPGRVFEMPASVYLKNYAGNDDYQEVIEVITAEAQEVVVNEQEFTATPIDMNDPTTSDISGIEEVVKVSEKKNKNNIKGE